MLSSATGSTGEQSVHGLSGFFAPDLDSPGELGDGGGTAPGLQKALAGFEVAAVVGGCAIGLFRTRRLPPAHEAQYLLAVAGGAPESDALYGAKLVHTPRLATGYLFEVRVVQNDVGGDLLAPRLVPAPGPQTFEELRIYRTGGSIGGPVRYLYRAGDVIRDGDTRLGGRPSGHGSVF